MPLKNTTENLIIPCFSLTPHHAQSAYKMEAEAKDENSSRWRYPEKEAPEDDEPEDGDGEIVGSFDAKLD